MSELTRASRLSECLTQEKVKNQGGSVRSRKRQAGKTGKALERHYSVKDAAAILGMPPSTLRTYLAQGLVARVKLPGKVGKVLLAESALVAFVERFREPARTEIDDELRRLESRTP